LNYVDAEKSQVSQAAEGKTAGQGVAGSEVTFGEYGLKAMETGWVSDRQIEAGRVAITRFVKRGGKIWIRVFPDKPITKKPAETRMGKGQRSSRRMGCRVRPGRFSMRWKGYRKIRRRKRCGSPGTNCVSSPSL